MQAGAWSVSRKCSVECWSPGQRFTIVFLCVVYMILYASDQTAVAVGIYIVDIILRYSDVKLNQTGEMLGCL